MLDIGQQTLASTCCNPRRDRLDYGEGEARRHSRDPGLFAGGGEILR